MRKYVKNGFIDVTEKSVQSTFSNPSTHEQDPCMRQEWVFIPSMLPDDAQMPRSIEGYKEEFDRIGKELTPLTTRNILEFDSLVDQCTKAIEKAYKERYEPAVNPGDEALSKLGFK